MSCTFFLARMLISHPSTLLYLVLSPSSVCRLLVGWGLWKKKENGTLGLSALLCLALSAPLPFTLCLCPPLPPLGGGLEQEAISQAPGPALQPWLVKSVLQQHNFSSAVARLAPLTPRLHPAAPPSTRPSSPSALRPITSLPFSFRASSCQRFSLVYFISVNVSIVPLPWTLRPSLLFLPCPFHSVFSRIGDQGGEKPTPGRHSLHPLDSSLPEAGAQKLRVPPGPGDPHRAAPHLASNPASGRRWPPYIVSPSYCMYLCIYTIYI